MKINRTIPNMKMEIKIGRDLLKEIDKGDDTSFRFIVLSSDISPPDRPIPSLSERKYFNLWN